MGPQQKALTDFIWRNPGATPYEWVSNHYRTKNGYRSNVFGYRVVHRAVKAGLIFLRERTAEGKRGCYRMYLPLY